MMTPEQTLRTLGGRMRGAVRAIATGQPLGPGDLHPQTLMSLTVRDVVTKVDDRLVLTDHGHAVARLIARQDTPSLFGGDAA